MKRTMKGSPRYQYKRPLCKKNGIYDTLSPYQNTVSIFHFSIRLMTSTKWKMDCNISIVVWTGCFCVMFYCFELLFIPAILSRILVFAVSYSSCTIFMNSIMSLTGVLNLFSSFFNLSYIVKQLKGRNHGTIRRFHFHMFTLSVHRSLSTGFSLLPKIDWVHSRFVSNWPNMHWACLFVLCI